MGKTIKCPVCKGDTDEPLVRLLVKDRDYGDCCVVCFSIFTGDRNEPDEDINL